MLKVPFVFTFVLIVKCEMRERLKELLSTKKLRCSGAENSQVLQGLNDAKIKK